MKTKKKKRTGEQMDLPFSEPRTDISDLLARVEFSPDNVVAESASHAMLFMKAINYRMEALRARNKAKAAYENRRAELSLSMRAKAREEGERLTEGNLDDALSGKSVLRKLRATYTEADEFDEYSKLLLELFRMRRDALRIVGDLTTSERGLQKYLEASQVELKGAKNKLEKKYSKG